MSDVSVPFPLVSGERVIISLRKHWTDWILAVILCALTSITIFLPIIILLLKYWAWKNRILTVTNQRIVLSEGMISRSQREIPLGHVNEVAYRQNATGRIIGFGTVELRTASGIILFGPVANPDQVRDQISAMVDAYRKTEEEVKLTKLAQSIGQAVAIANRSIQ